MNTERFRLIIYPLITSTDVFGKRELPYPYIFIGDVRLDKLTLKFMEFERLLPLTAV